MDMNVDFEDYKNIIEELNPENYELLNLFARNEEELRVGVLDYLKDKDNEADIDICFAGEGHYDIVGLNFGFPCIDTIENILWNELEQVEFPFTLNENFISNHEKWVSDVKNKSQCEFIYLITHRIFINIPNEYVVKYIIYSNKKMTSDEIKSHFEDNNINCGEFGIFFANHFVEDINAIDISNISKYSFDYDVIHIN